MKAKNRFCLMLLMVACDSRRARTRPVRSPLSSVTPALSIATSVPVPMATPTSAAAIAGASLTPSPAMPTTRPASRSGPPALPGGWVKMRVWGVLAPGWLRPRHDRSRKGMFAAALHGRREPQHGVLAPPGDRFHGDDLRLALRQRAGLVDHQGID